MKEFDMSLKKDEEQQMDPRKKPLFSNHKPEKGLIISNKKNYKTSSPTNNKLEIEVEKYSKELEAADSLLVEQNTEIFDLRNALERSKQYHEKLSSQLENALTSIAEKDTELLNIKESLSDIQARYNQLFSQQGQLRAEVDDSRLAIDHAQSEARHFAEKLEESEALNKSLSAEISVSLDKYIDKSIKISVLQRQIDIYRHSNALKDNETIKLKNKLRETTQKRDTLSLEIKSKNNTINTLRESNKSKSEKITSLEEKILNKASELLEVNKSISLKNEIITALEVENNFINNSIFDIKLKNKSEIDWMSKAYAILNNEPWWWSLMPNSWVSQKKHEKLVDSGVFDAEEYLRSHPDVAEAGVDPIDHYILHGIHEGRNTK